MTRTWQLSRDLQAIMDQHPVNVQLREAETRLRAEGKGELFDLMKRRLDAAAERTVDEVLSRGTCEIGGLAEIVK